MAISKDLEQLMSNRISPQDFHFSLLRFVKLRPAKCLRRQRSLLPTKQDDIEFNPEDSHGRREKKQNSSKLSSDL